jgi:hypothetical protein
MAKMSVPVPMNVYLVLVVAVDPLPQSLILFKSITKSSFNGVSRQPVLGQSIIGPVLNLHLAAPPRGDGLQRTSTPKNIATQSSIMAVKALRL